MENLELYNSWRKVPEDAQKPIKGGRLKGMTDIEPMWRIRVLTERFGPCGIGWKWVEIEHWIETSMARDEIAAFVRGNLYIKYDGQWSDPIYGIGGSMLVAQEKNGLYTNDEAFKMATTDAISVACKMLGIGADIYWGKSNTKYNDSKIENTQAQRDITSELDKLSKMTISRAHAQNIRNKAASMDIPIAVVLNQYKVGDIDDLTEADYGDCMNKFVEEEIKRERKK